MKKTLFAVICATILASCGGISVNSEILWDDNRKDICDVYMQYVNAMANGDSQRALDFEDRRLWQTLDPIFYDQLRISHPEFGTLLAKSKIVFTECTTQKDWGIFGQTFESAYMFSFTVEMPENLDPKEKVYADIIKGRTFTTAGVFISDQWKFLPVFGPELLEIDQATKSYQAYIDAIKKGDFRQMFSFTPASARQDYTVETMEAEWKQNAAEIPELANIMNPRPVSGRIIFNPIYEQIKYPWAVLLEVQADYAKAEAIPNQTDQTKLIIEDYKQGINSVMMLPEEIWKPATINVLFGAPGQEQ
jgi:hypothetical protein